MRWILCLSCLTLLSPLVRAQPAAPSPAEVASNIVAHEAGFWRSCAKPDDSITSRDLFAYALALCEARQHPERLARLFELAERMQDRNPQSRGFGNFWWSWRDGKVMDYNAVDFSMRGGSLLWRNHRDFMPSPARERLAKLLEFSSQGCRRHQVQPSYSNIAIMNAGDLILLGEALGKSDVADEGYARLDRLFQYTRTAGVHEFDSPTYTGVDLTGLGMIEALARREAGRAEARTLLELFWTDIALNWFPPAQKLAGAQSRTYDYLRGLGDLDQQLAWNAWLEMPLSASVDSIFIVQANWHPPEKIRGLSREFPRLVRQSWGEKWWQSRTHWLLPDITLSCAAASYGGRMDMPLTVDLPGDRKSVRGYFIADGRDDPYGLKKIAAGAHQKAFHLNPFWAAAQKHGDALGLAVYRAVDLPTNATTLVSDFVLPVAMDSWWIGDRRIALDKDHAAREPVNPGEVVTFQKGAAACGLRVPWTRGLDGREARIYLIYDGNPYGAARLAVEHVAPGTRPEFSGHAAGAALWIRIGSGLKSAADFAAWRQRFAAAAAEVDAATDRVRLRVGGVDGPVAVSAQAPWKAPEALEPAPSRAVLELNGEDLGDRIFAR